MTDNTNRDDTGETKSTAADETFAWSAEPESSTNPSGQGRDWVRQLQSMIDQLTTQAGPVIKEIGAKAAELAAIAGDKAGPVAQKAAEVTGQAGQKLAEKSRDFAAELRRDTPATDETASTDPSVTADEPPTAAGVH
ncbi:MAG: hypothetical protein QOI09_740 [Chloroflexota bacterium]|nr:hypothetical protein [Chloroflexota bacterium]